MKRARVQNGSVVFNRKYGTWNFLWVENGRRRSQLIGTLQEYKCKEAASLASEALRQALNEPRTGGLPTIRSLVKEFRREKMPERFSTQQGYNSWLNNHILPRWGSFPITGLQARPVELWLKDLPISAKSRVHIRGLVRALWDYAMWRGEIPTQRNPMELVSIKGATKRGRKPRSLTVEEFQSFVRELEEPVRTIALVCVCFGLRISECLGLKWGDVDWLNSALSVERSIVRQRVGDVKTIYSGRTMSVDAEMLAVLKSWKQATQFPSETDWIFASPIRVGRLPVSYPWVWQMFQEAGARSGIGKLGTHSLRHSYRSWLDAIGTPVAVQQKLMRHADIRTTFNIYGDVVTNEMAQAHSKVVRLALPKAS
ncbi:MAG: site-specific integrase [Terriglobales bacterium]